MADVAVWGLLPKAQDDGTTIDEAIAAAIVAHEEDPEAHMGTGESIDVHRVNTVIDHPQASIVPDKLTSVGLTFFPVFESLSSYYKVGTHVTSSIALLNFTNASASTEFNNIAAGTSALGLVFDFSNEIVFQFALALSVWTNTRLYGVLGSSPDEEQLNSVGFRFQSGAVVAYIGYFGTDDSFHEVTSTISGITLSAQNFYRVHVRPVDSEIDFYVNGELAVTLAYPDDDLTYGASGFLFSLSLQPTSSVAFTAYFSQFYYGRLP